MPISASASSPGQGGSLETRALVVEHPHGHRKGGIEALGHAATALNVDRHATQVLQHSSQNYRFRRPLASGLVRPVTSPLARHCACPLPGAATVAAMAAVMAANTASTAK